MLSLVVTHPRRSMLPFLINYMARIEQLKQLLIDYFTGLFLFLTLAFCQGIYHFANSFIVCQVVNIHFHLVPMLV